MATKTGGGVEYKNGNALSGVKLKYDDLLGVISAVAVDNPSQKPVWVRITWSGGQNVLEFTIPAGGTEERVLSPAPVLDLLGDLGFGGSLECRW